METQAVMLLSDKKTSLPQTAPLLWQNPGYATGRGAINAKAGKAQMPSKMGSPSCYGPP